ncbi:hypothetical protein NC651_034259 [Populus alba x Populus x berolinensis]|nr:hypothetical protein NC651_034259 [Populus alba x Populus x berolinensis]
MYYRLKWRSPINLLHMFTEVHEQQPGRTSRTIHFLSFPQSTQQRIAKRCNELFSVCAPSAGLHGVRDWLK